MAIPERNLFTSSFYYSKQTTFCQSLPYRLLWIITQAEKLLEGVNTKAKICHHFKKLWIYSAPCPESAKSISVERRASHRFPSEWDNRERETLLPPLALGEDSNLRLAALSHVATWMEIFCASSRTALTGRFIMWGSAARGPPQTPAAAWTSSGARLSGGVECSATAAPWFVGSLCVRVTSLQFTSALSCISNLKNNLSTTGREIELAFRGTWKQVLHKQSYSAMPEMTRRYHTGRQGTCKNLKLPNVGMNKKN